MLMLLQTVEMCDIHCLFFLHVLCSYGILVAATAFYCILLYIPMVDGNPLEMWALLYSSEFLKKLAKFIFLKKNIEDV